MATLPYQDQNFYPPIVVNQHHYYMGHPSQGPNVSFAGQGALMKHKLGSVVNLNDFVPGNIVHHVFDDGLSRWHGQATQLLNQSAAVCDQISSRLNEIMTMIDGDQYVGNEKDLFTYQPVSAASPPSESLHRPSIDSVRSRKANNKRDVPKGQTTAVASSLMSGGYFAKVELYANSRLPMTLPPLKL
jgi:hypothetical protein